MVIAVTFFCSAWPVLVGEAFLDDNIDILRSFVHKFGDGPPNRQPGALAFGMFFFNY